ncbi:S60 ribosomal protein L35 [Cavenderia fasciculata]|uniref:S60 ribosomal protein L35 n=1 Tax=Cavenderia fasciculata TaxID=261658 RepID=F4QBG7_CACFS|nr:S60 ribosomal protein L35 [Cavenderia fasciculata]EGG14939.1 S60 ribosomal protein L35 [Cavenderia fasciculata]|eukprot:XP_004351455.1 S60 ribosomal protein L35 [Cavenderia fasciculata]
MSDKIKAKELRKLKRTELIEKLQELRTELSTLRVGQVKANQPNKLSQITEVRKSIARVLTVFNTSRKEQLRKYYKDTPVTKRPYDLRTKITRAMRQRLTPKQLAAKPLKVQKVLENFPKRVFYVKA